MCGIVWMVLKQLKRYVIQFIVKIVLTIVQYTTQLILISFHIIVKFKICEFFFCQINVQHILETFFQCVSFTNNFFSLNLRNNLVKFSI